MNNNLVHVGPHMIRLNQNETRHHEQEEMEVANLYKAIFNKIQYYLASAPYNILIKNPIFIQYSDDLLNYLSHSYVNCLSYNNHIEADTQAQTVVFIRKMIEKIKFIIRINDKSTNIYIVLAMDCEGKIRKENISLAQMLLLERSSNNPFKEILNQGKKQNEPH